MSDAALTDSTAPMESTWSSAVDREAKMCEMVFQRYTGGTLTALSDFGASARKLDEDHVSKGFLGVLGDSDRTDIRGGVERDPLVIGGISG